MNTLQLGLNIRKEVSNTICFINCINICKHKNDKYHILLFILYESITLVTLLSYEAILQLREQTYHVSLIA